jgi:hypothetical protein
MPTAKQIAASRLNGQKSNGPATPEGKAKSRFNALKHGIHAETRIIFDETAEDLAELAADFHEQYSPADAAERFLVDTLVHNEWRLRRMRCVEAALWQTGVDTYLNQHMELEAATSSDAFGASAPVFERLQRIVNCCERNYHRALKALVASGHARSTAQPEESTTTSESPGSFRANPQTPAAAAPKAPPQPPANPVATVDGLPPQHLEETAVLDASFQATLGAA